MGSMLLPRRVPEGALFESTAIEIVPENALVSNRLDSYAAGSEQFSDAQILLNHRNRA